MTNRFVAGLLLVVLLLASALLCPAAVQKQTLNNSQGSRLPSFETVDLSGHKISSADLKNKVVLIDFWATWCAPCRKEMPGYQQLLDKYGSRGLRVIGFKVDFMKDTEDPVRFLSELKITYPIVLGTERIRKLFGEIQGLPTTFVYDRKGILRSKVIGFQYTKDVEAVIAPLL